MSTRATYEFNSKNHPKVAVYIHYDGYPTGAAMYFYAALNAENQRGSFATRFVKSNELAELTESHDAHGDTEWRYTYDEATSVLHVSERIGFSEDWRQYYSGSLAAFVNAHTDHLPKGARVAKDGRTYERLAKSLLSLAGDIAVAETNGWTGNAEWAKRKRAEIEALMNS